MNIVEETIVFVEHASLITVQIQVIQSVVCFIIKIAQAVDVASTREFVYIVRMDIIMIQQQDAKHCENVIRTVKKEHSHGIIGIIANVMKDGIEWHRNPLKFERSIQSSSNGCHY